METAEEGGSSPRFVVVYILELQSAMDHCIHAFVTHRHCCQIVMLKVLKCRRRHWLQLYDFQRDDLASRACSSDNESAS